jgi:hypothetical protein
MKTAEEYYKERNGNINAKTKDELWTIQLMKEYGKLVFDEEESQIKEYIQEKEKPIRKSRGYGGSKIKICAGCGSFAHGNPGHDIT